MESNQDTGINTDLYFRQIGTFGMEMMGKLIQMKVLIVGLRGLGAETAKNIILAGPHRVDIYDPTTVETRDLGANFYLKESHVGNETRADASVGKLKELNPYVKVDVVSDKLTAEICSAYDVVVFTELFHSTEELFQINESLREANKGFILSQTLGLYGYTFTDYGNEFIVLDQSGEDNKSFIVTSITNDKEAVVTVHEDKRHVFHDASYVRLTEVEGMEEINNTEPIPITVIDGYSFKLKLDTTSFGKYTGGGLVESCKMPKKIKFNSLRESLAKPLETSLEGMFHTPDFGAMDRPGVLHIVLQGILKFHDKHGNLPEDTENDTKAVFDFAKEINEEHKSNEGSWALEDIDEIIFNNASRFAKASITPMASFFGGIVAQEIVKFTGKYTPFTQWFHFDSFKSLPKSEVNRESTGSRYDDQILIFGQEVQEKLLKLKVFLVGAGALGCEYIKTFALMGLGGSKDGLVSCTDNDNIEVSNLNRQFLFRSNNVGHSKSETACRVGGEMNPNFNVQSYQTLVAPQTENLFNDDFWENIDFIVNAVDNINARLYVDSQAVWHKKALLESGTLGTKANSQMILPNLTRCYGDSKDPEEDSIPMCTLRNFPNQIEHTIEWGRDQFNKFFTDSSNDVRDFLENPEEWLKNLNKNNTISGQIDVLTMIKDLVEVKKEGTFENCVKFSVQKFTTNFTHSIQQLLYLFPKDYKTKEGQPFWGGPKRCPDVIELDTSDPLHIHFISACANLIAYNIGIEQNRNKEEIAQMASKVTIAPFVPKTYIKIKTEEDKETEEGKKVEEEETPEEEQKHYEQLISELTSGELGVTKDDFHPADFEKDDDENFHIDFIHAVANLRARNYRIVECDQIKTKLIAGKIIPAIATTTAMIVGAVGLELYKVVQGFDQLEDYKDGFINLAIQEFIFTEPNSAIQTKDTKLDMRKQIMPSKAIPENWTIWETIEVKGPKTIQEFVDWLKDEYNVEVNVLSCQNEVIYNALLPGTKQAARLPKKIEEVFTELGGNVEGKKYLRVDVAAEVISEGIDAVMPCFKYVIR